MKDANIAFIGGGHMATSFIGGLVNDGYSPQKLWVSNPNDDKLSLLRQKFSVNTTVSNEEAVQAADIVVFAVKPQILSHVAHDLADVVQRKKPLVVSIAAGVRIKDLSRWLGGDVAVVRCMPNTPSLIGCGASGMYANELVSQEQRNQSESILRSVGLALWLKEERLLDAVTALSGSGPAYFFLVMESLVQAAEVLGIEKQSARLLTLQTAIGAARMALESGEDLAQLRQQVTSTAGVTEKALRALESGGMRQLFAHAFQEANRRSEEIADMLGQVE